MVGEIKPLTSLRIFLAVWVVCRHLLYVYGGNHANAAGLNFPLQGLLGKGYLGVDGFFILSGFILAYNYADKLDTFRPKEYGRFILARFARVYPVHLFTLIVFALLLGVSAYGRTVDTGGPKSFLNNALLLQSWHISHPATFEWNDVSWSVSCEWFAYLLFPLALKVARPAKNSAAIVIVLLLGALYVAESLSATHLSLPFTLWRIVPEFLIGACLYRIYRSGISLPRWSSLVAMVIVALGIFSGIDAIVVAGFAAIILSLASDRDILKSPLSKSALVYGGQISYCVYMVQRLVQSVVYSHHISLPPAVRFAVFLVVLLIVSAATHHLIEEPARSLIRTLTAARKRIAFAAATS